MALTQISTAGVKDDAVTAGKIPADAIGSSEIAANAVGSSELADNAVDNAAVASNAAIAGTKISPDFGSQNIVTTGSISGAAGTFTGDLTIPDKIVHTGDTDTAIRLGIDTVTVETAGSERLRVDSSGFVGIGMSPSAGGTGYMLQLDSGAAQTFMTFGNSGSGNGASNGLVVGNDTSRAYFTQRENQPIHIATNNVDRLVIDASGHLLPATDSSYDLGLTGTRWRYVYADAYYGDGSNLTGINTDLVSDTSPQLGGNLDTNSFEILLDDSHAVKFGDSNDLQIYHDGSHTRIDNETGGLFLRNNTGTYNGEPIKIQALSGENSIQCVPNGRVELYYDNSKKLETTSSGAEFFGNFDGGDSQQIRLGDSQDLKIYHDGTTNIIEGLDGNMSIRPKTGENGILLRNNGAVDLYYDDVKKFETTSAGTSVSGNLVCGSVTLSGGGLALADNDQVVLGSGDDAFIKHTGSDLLIENDTGALNIKCTSGTGVGEGIVYFASGNGTTRTVLQSDGHFRPFADNAYYLGTANHRWANIYTADLNLSNEGSSNDVDGTWGSWTIQEGESDLFLKNNRSGKKYKFNLTEVT